MGKAKEGSGRSRTCIGKQNGYSIGVNACFSSCNHGRACAYADVDIVNLKESEKEKGESDAEIFEEQKRNGNGSSGHTDCSCHKLGTDIQDPNHPVCKHNICGFERVNFDGIKGVLNKRGEEIVEAAMVLPVLILIVVALMGIAVFHIGSMYARCNLHRELASEIRSDKAIIKTLKKEIFYSSQTGGVANLNMTRDYEEWGYVLDEAAMIRAGELFE